MNDLTSSRRFFSSMHAPDMLDEAKLFTYIKGLADKKELSADTRIQKSAEWAEEIHTGQWRKYTDEPHSAHTRFVAKAYEHYFPGDFQGIQTAHLHDAEEDAHKHPLYLLEKLAAFQQGKAGETFGHFAQKNLGPLMREFLKKLYGIVIGKDGHLSIALAAVASPAKNSDPAAVLKYALEDATHLNNPEIGNDKFTHFIINKIFIDGGGQPVQYGLYILSRLSHEDRFNFAFIDPRGDAFVRKRTATIKCCDVWHNLRTLDFETPGGLAHADKALSRTIWLVPYLGSAGDPRAFAVMQQALEKAYMHWKERKPGSPSLNARLQAANEKMVGQLRAFRSAHASGTIGKQAFPVAGL